MISYKISISIVLLILSLNVNSQFSEPIKIIDTPLRNATTSQSIDFNLDGYTDLIVNTNGQSKVKHLYINNGNELEYHSSFILGGIFPAYYYDLDSDGDLDAISNNIVFENKDGVFESIVELGQELDIKYQAYDMDGDGFAELFPSIMGWNTDNSYQFFEPLVRSIIHYMENLSKIQ